MLVRVWEYDVPEGSRDEFERVYGADGDWARLFSSSSGYAGTELFASLSTPGRYVTVDRFSDDAAWEAFLAKRWDAYVRLDEQTAGLTTAERALAGPVVD